MPNAKASVDYFPPHRHFGGSPFQKQIAMSTPLRPKTLTRKPSECCCGIKKIPASNRSPQ